MKQLPLNVSIFFTVLVISLSICIFYFSSNFMFCKPCAVDMVIYHPHISKGYDYQLEEFLKSKNFATYSFTENEEFDKPIFSAYRKQVESLVQSKDTITGIHFKFNKYTSYKQFIDVFDVCYLNDATFVYYKDDLWILNKLASNSKNSHLFANHRPIKI